jgi:acyl carrier protein
MGESIESRIKRVINAFLNCGLDAVTPEARLTRDLGSDSLDFVEIVMAIEEEFGIEIADEVAVEWKTVADIIKHVTERYA